MLDDEMTKNNLDCCWVSFSTDMGTPGSSGSYGYILTVNDVENNTPQETAKKITFFYNKYFLYQWNLNILMQFLTLLESQFHLCGKQFLAVLPK